MIKTFWEMINQQYPKPNSQNLKEKNGLTLQLRWSRLVKLRNRIVPHLMRKISYRTRSRIRYRVHLCSNHPLSNSLRSYSTINLIPDGTIHRKMKINSLLMHYRKFKKETKHLAKNNLNLHSMRLKIEMLPILRLKLKSPYLVTQ